MSHSKQIYHVKKDYILDHKELCLFLGQLYWMINLTRSTLSYGKSGGCKNYFACTLTEIGRLWQYDRDRHCTCVK